MNQYKIFFFGSRVTGKSDERSDIDVGIESEKSVPAAVLLNIQEKFVFEEDGGIVMDGDNVEFSENPPFGRFSV